jgi:putative PEP-CTERM system TPR-repeat lipoprotein
MADPILFQPWRLLLLCGVFALQPAWADPESAAPRPVPRESLTQLKLSVRADPVNAEKRFNLGLKELISGDYFSAERELSLARQRGYSADSVAVGLAQSLLHLGRNQDVLTLVQPCANDRVCALTVGAVQARAMLRVNIVDEAGRRISQINQEAPDLLEGKMARAEFLLAREDIAQAESLIDGMVAGPDRPDEPAWVDALQLKGDLRRRAGDFKSAESWYRRILSHYPGSAPAHSRLALTLLAQNRLTEADAEIEPLLQRSSPNLLPLYLGALIKSGLGEMRAALATVRPTERQLGEVPQGSLLLAILHAGNGNLEEAITYAVHFHLMKMDDLSALLLLARLQFDLGDYHRVLDLLTPVEARIATRPEAQTLLGSAYLALGQNHAAVERLAVARRLAPQDRLTEARLALAESREIEDRAEGLRVLEDLLSQDPSDPMIGMVLLSTYLDLAQPLLAAKVADRMIEGRPDDPLPLALRGALAFGQGDLPAAEQYFLRAKKIRANFPPADLFLAEIAIKDGRIELARSLIRPALKRNPNDLGFLLAAAALGKQLGDRAEINADLDRAISLQGDNLVYQGQLLQGLIAIGETDRAERVANGMAANWAADATGLDIAARALLRVGQAEQAVPLLTRIQNTLPNTLESWLQLGRAYHAAGRLDQARLAFDRALAIDPAMERAIAGRVDVESEQKGAAAALSLTQRLLAAAGTGEVAKSCGDLLAKNNRLAAALPFYQVAFERHKSSASLRDWAQTRLRSGDEAGLAQSLSDWLAHDPDHPDLRALLAEALMKDQNLPESARQWALVLGKQPGNAVAANNLAWLYGKLQDPRAYEMAQRAFQLAPDQPQIMDTFGMQLIARGERARGGDLLKQAASAEPDNPLLEFHYAEFLADGDDRAGARKLLRALIERNQPFEEADQARQLYLRLGQGG